MQLTKIQNPWRKPDTFEASEEGEINLCLLKPPNRVVVRVFDEDFGIHDDVGSKLIEGKRKQYHTTKDRIRHLS